MVKLLQMRKKQKALSSPSFVKRISLSLIALVIGISLPISVASPAKADEFDERIGQIQAEINSYQAKAQSFRDQANSLQVVIDSFNIQIVKSIGNAMEENAIVRNHLLRFIKVTITALWVAAT